MDKQKAIIIGASSGIGLALAKVLSENGYEVGLCARRFTLLEELQRKLPSRSYVMQMDVSKDREAIQKMEELVEKMGGVDLVVVNSGIGYENPGLDWDKEKETIGVNATGFAALAVYAFKYFWDKNSGHLVGISSIAALRGMGEAPTYSATKAFSSNLLQGLFYRARRAGKNICVTDVKPGFVDTKMAMGDFLFWVASPDEAARQIFAAIKKKKKHVYVTRRWRIIAWMMKIVPDCVYYKF